MFNVGWSEVFLIIAIGFLLFKPSEFPSFFHTIYKIYKLLVRYFQHLRGYFYDFAEQMEIEAIKNDRIKKAPLKKEEKIPSIKKKGS